MKVTKCWVTGRPDGKGYLASVSMDLELEDGYSIQIRGMRLVEIKNKGIVLKMASIKDSKGNWQLLVVPQNQATQELLLSAAINEWSKLWPNPELKDILEPL